MINDNLSNGIVVFAGAGPGDAELITVKAAKHLALADVVICDRLVNPLIISIHASQAEVIYVGKQGYNSSSTPQTTINQLLVEYARQGKYVVRLKGGDISIFGNLLDELEAVSSNNIAYQLVPGITAASGAAAAFGIPLTARGFSTGVRLLTWHNAAAIDDCEWSNLAQTSDTLVFYMTGKTAVTLAHKLIDHGKNANTPVLLAEQVTTPFQKASLSTLDECTQLWTGQEFISPALFIVGDVCRLYTRFGSGESKDAAHPFFQHIETLLSK